jgi:hypothetical protein
MPIFIGHFWRKKYLELLATSTVIRIFVADARRRFFARRFSDHDNADELSRATKHM